MADEPAVATGAPPPAPAVDAAAPAVPTAAPAPVAPAIETAAPAAEAPAEPAAPTEAAPAEAAPAEASPAEAAPSLVSSAESEAKTEQGEAAETAPIQFEPFALPEGVQVDPKGMESFTGILGNAEMTPQERGQALIDLYIENGRQLVERVTQHQQAEFDRLRGGWRDSFERDPDLGGNRRDTTLRVCASLRDRFAGNDAQRQEFIDALNYTGMGDHPAFIRFLANVGRALAEGVPLGASAPARGVGPQLSGIAPGSRIERRYINTQGMNGNAH